MTVKEWAQLKNKASFRLRRVNYPYVDYMLDKNFKTFQIFNSGVVPFSEVSKFKTHGWLNTPVPYQ